MKKLALFLACFLALEAAMSLALTPFKGYDQASSRATRLPAAFDGYRFPGQGKAAYGWMHLIHLEQGGWMTLLFSHAEVAPYSGTSSIGLLYTAGGKQRICQGTWSSGENFIAPPPGRYRIGIGNSTFGGAWPRFFVDLEEKDCQGELRFDAVVPPFAQGSGVATFGADQKSFWRLLAIAPRAKASGFIQFPDAKVEIKGDAYLEVVANNVVVPDMADRWYILRSVSGAYTLNLFDIVLDRKTYGDAHLRTLMLSRDNEILMGTSSFTYEVTQVKEDANKVPVPNVFHLSATDGALSLSGDVRTGEVLDAMSLVDRMSPAFKLVAGLKYGKLWQYRTAARYDLTLKEGEKSTRIQGTGFKEIHFYDR